jgi:hypothetical protein
MEAIVHDRPLCADIVDLVVAVFRELPFSRRSSIFWGVVSESGSGIGADLFGAVIPARDMRLASLEALRASLGSAPWPRVGTRLARRSDRAT